MIKVLRIKNYNCGLINIDTWKEKEWIIFDDMSVYYTITFNSFIDNKVVKFKLNKDDFKKIANNIELAKNDETIIEAYDGETWEFIEYKNNKEIWRRDMGYIYGVIPLENITDILIKCTKY